MQAVKVVVPMDGHGNLRLPDEVRRGLAVDGASLVEVEIAEGRWVLRPTESIPDEDVWAYTPEHVATVKRALARPPGEDLRLSPVDLERLIEGARE